ncbi:AGAP011636-PA-like protein [Anopheles sinensis]|uniref:AGAP011636-PA-like protein n=1 Tax=Anopheles sinensis TaxID=74873 RepID=A0A084WQ22_ANOSI|nr:AGAP011636-PA-like protein [Anopheles sinensis]
MAQGKLKVKSKPPQNSKKPQNKGSAFSKRKNAPIQSKKHKFLEDHKLKQVITKTVNKKNEDDLRKVAYEGQTKLSQAQLAVQEHHRKQAQNSSASEAGSSKA